MSLVQAAACDDDVEMRMEEDILIPGMEDSCESHFCSQAVPLSCEFEQRFGSGLEQEVVESLLVLEDDWVQFMRDSEDHVEVGYGKDFLKSLLDPAHALQALAFRAVPVPAGIVRDTLVSTPVLTYVHMTAQRLGPTVFNVLHCLSLLRAHWILGAVMLTISAKDIRNLQGRSEQPRRHCESRVCMHGINSPGTLDSTEGYPEGFL